MTWTCGLLAATQRLTVFGTVHVPLFPPVLAAKQIVTADHIGRGRFGLNLVCGWNQAEFDMFGLEQDAHDERYARGQEWLDILLRLWSAEAPFDDAGRYYHLKGVTGRPRPWGGRRPILMNAGNSVAGRAFGARTCDLVFDQPHHLEQARDRILGVRRVARECGKEIQVFTSGAVVCRPTQQEADEYFPYCAVEHRDDGAIDTMLNLYLSPANQRAMTRAELAPALHTIRVPRPPALAEIRHRGPSPVARPLGTARTRGQRTTQGRLHGGRLLPRGAARVVTGGPWAGRGWMAS
jgi:alkanesulfonate monooxygenase SsuD/methylene tetrahydromethanopterin reductase-like flavin-dependent oxidoreductase (luciferase family)